MNRAALEQIVRAAAAACGEREIVIIGWRRRVDARPAAREPFATGQVVAATGLRLSVLREGMSYSGLGVRLIP